jgi:hypothetical protein
MPGLSRVVVAFSFVLLMLPTFHGNFWRALTLTMKTLTILPSRWKKRNWTKMMKLDPRIKTVKCSGCKVECDVRVAAQVDLQLETCDRNDPNIAARLGYCPFRQTLEHLEKQYAKSQNIPRKMEIPRLLEAKSLPNKMVEHPHAKTDCPEGGAHCQHGVCGPCQDGDYGPVSRSLLVVNQIRDHLANISKAPKIVKLENGEVEIECDDVIMWTMDKKGRVTEGVGK